MLRKADLFLSTYEWAIPFSIRIPLRRLNFSPPQKSNTSVDAFPSSETKAPTPVLLQTVEVYPLSKGNLLTPSQIKVPTKSPLQS